jgi:chloride channel protein, CIC family
MQAKFIHWLDRWKSSESIIMGGVAVAVGLASGAGVWIFKRLIDLAHLAAFDYLGGGLAHLGSWTVILVPAVGGLVVGLLLKAFVGNERYHGVAGVMEVVALGGGRLRYKRMPAKTIASALSIGSGASVGPEDPSVQIGANLGSMFGQWLHLSDDYMNGLVAAGAASGIAAAFNAPIAGVFFALEVILGEISSTSLSVVVLAAVVSSVFTQAVSGPQPAFHVPTYTFGSAWELPVYFGLGLLSGPVSALYIWLLYAAQDIFHLIPKIPQWMKPVAAGLIIGLVGFFLPQVLGVGYDTIGSILAGESNGIMLLVALLVAKLFLTPVSIAGGFPGGVFAPSLFIGATFGAVYGWSLSRLFPFLNIVLPVYAMVGMAAVLAGAVRAPLTAIILLFEMTNDYRIILPLMFAVIVSSFVSNRFLNDSVYTLALARKGIRLERGRDIEVLETLTVGDVMEKTPDALQATDSLAKASEIFIQTRHHGIPVLDSKNELVGVFTLRDLDHTLPEKWSISTVGESCTHDLVVTYPDENLGAALRRMGARDIGRLPVVDPEHPAHMVGLLRRTDLVRAYDVALTHRAAIRHRAHQERLDTTTSDDVEIEELTIEAGALCVGKRVKEIPWPRDCIVSTLRRGRIVFIPHGDTVLRSGDILVIVSEKNAREEMQRLCSAMTSKRN